MMEESVLVYDEDERAVIAKADNESVELYTDVSREEFERIDTVESFVSDTSRLFEELFQVLIHQRDLISQGAYFDRLGSLQQKAAKQYGQCLEYQEELADVESDAVATQLKQLYKVNKFLKHYFRALTIAQSLGFSQRLLTQYTKTQDNLHLYGFVRNVCSTVEYLGKLMENRMGEGEFELDDKSLNAFDVYEELKQQNLDEVFNPDQVIQVPPTNEKMKQGELRISTGSMDYLWDKRCDIVHDCPLVVPEKTIEHLPKDIVSTSVLTTSDVKKLTHLAFRVHFHSISMFLNFVLSYQKKQLEAMVDAWYLEQES